MARENLPGPRCEIDGAIRKEDTCSPIRTEGLANRLRLRHSRALVRPSDQEITIAGWTIEAPKNAGKGGVAGASGSCAPAR
jgi:hypothetical protein